MHASPPDTFPPMTEAEYLAFADGEETKYEYHQGSVYAMIGVTVRHGVITMNIGTQLNIALGERDCSVTSPDVRVHVAARQAYRYPDVTLFCGEPTYLPGRTDTITNPSLLVEVLSPSTALQDRNEKLADYTQIASLDAYMLVSQDTPKVEVFRRYEGTRWLYEYVTGLDATIGVPIAGDEFTLTLATIY